MNSVVLIGRLTRDPELRYLPGSGSPMARFSIAVDKQISKERKQEMEAKGQATADFINIVVWNKQAENCANFLAKGRLVAVQGRLQSGSYEAQDGSRRYTMDVVAERVQFLEWGDRPAGGVSQSNTYGNQTNTGSAASNNLDSFGFGGDFFPTDDDQIPF